MLEVDSFTDQPGAISGVGQITARVPYTVLAPGPLNVTLTMNDLPAGPLAATSGEGPTGTQDSCCGICSALKALQYNDRT